MDRNHRPLEDRLHEERPQLSPIALDELKRTVLHRTSHQSSSKAGFLKSRLALTFVLATGLLMSGTGATMAVTGIAGSGNAAQNQYGAPDSGGVLGDQQGGGGTDTTGDGTNTTGDNSGDVLGQQNSGSNCPNASAARSNGPIAHAACPGDSNKKTSDTGSGNVAGQHTQSTIRANDQVAAASDGKLPFTGLVVFPLLLGGVALLLAGGLLRRRTDTP